jgi:hypothetical protein
VIEVIKNTAQENVIQAYKNEKFQSDLTLLEEKQSLKTKNLLLV